MVNIPRPANGDFPQRDGDKNQRRAFTYKWLNMDEKARKEFDRAVDLGLDRAELEKALSEW